jgi:hypothetical protein
MDSNVFTESPGGGLESRLWAADAGRGQGARTARPDEEYAMPKMAEPGDPCRLVAASKIMFSFKRTMMP